MLAPLALAVAACTATPAPLLSRHDQDDVARVAAYLNSIPRFEARFTQTGDFGPGAGLVWLDRPGHLRLDYQGAGSRVMVIADGRVNILDRSNGALTTQPVSRTPLGILLAPTIQLDGPVSVTSLVHDGAPDAPLLELSVTKTKAAGQGSLTLQLAEQPLRLLGVTVRDPYQRVLSLRLTDMDSAPALTPNLFQPPAPGS